MGDDGFGGDMGFSDASFSAGLSDNDGLNAAMSDSALGSLGESFNGFDFNDPAFNASFNDPSSDDDGGALNASLAAAAQGELGEDGFLGKFRGFLANQALGKGIGMALGKAGLSGFQGPLGLAQAGSKGNASFGSSIGSMGLGILGTALGGPVGGAIGGALGSSLGSSALGGVTANAGMNGAPAANGENGTGGMDWGTLAQGLAGMYMGNKASNQYNDHINGLNSIFSPGGQYAQALRQQLERKDAAAGRRSQHGPREAQLMAALAQQQAQTMGGPGMANLMRQRQTNQNQGLQTILGLLGKSGMGNQAISGLGSLFGFGNQGTSFDSMPQVSLGSGGSDFGGNDFFGDGTDIFGSGFGG